MTRIFYNRQTEYSFTLGCQGRSLNETFTSNDCCRYAGLFRCYPFPTPVGCARPSTAIPGYNGIGAFTLEQFPQSFPFGSKLVERNESYAGVFLL